MVYEVDSSARCDSGGQSDVSHRFGWRLGRPEVLSRPHLNCQHLARPNETIPSPPSSIGADGLQRSSA